VVKVVSGTYTENVDIRKKITLEGVDTGSGKPVVDANSKGNGMTIYSTGQATISGFKLINAKNQPSGTIWAGIYANSITTLSKITTLLVISSG